MKNIIEKTRVPSLDDIFHGIPPHCRETSSMLNLLSEVLNGLRILFYTLSKEKLTVSSYVALVANSHCFNYHSILTLKAFLFYFKTQPWKHVFTLLMTDIFHDILLKLSKNIIKIMSNRLSQVLNRRTKLFLVLYFVQRKVKGVKLRGLGGQFTLLQLPFNFDIKNVLVLFEKHNREDTCSISWWHLSCRGRRHQESRKTSSMLCRIPLTEVLNGLRFLLHTLSIR